MTNLENLKKLAEGLGADASKCSTNLGALNVISKALGGSGDAGTNAEAIEDIAQAAPGMMIQDVVWTSSTLTLSDSTTLTAVTIPNGVTSIAGFTNQTALASVSIPESVKIVDSGCFNGCTALTEITAIGVERVSGSSMNNCTRLKKVDLHSAKELNMACFANNSALATLILRSNEVAELDDYVFQNTPIASGTGYVYVHKDLVNSYKADRYWSTYASQIRAIEDYPDICG